MPNSLQKGTKMYFKELWPKIFYIIFKIKQTLFI